MKKILLTLFLSVMLFACISVPTLAQEQAKISVLIDGLPVTFDVEPVIENGRTLVPFRAIAEALNVEVHWDGSTQTINSSDGKTSVSLQIGSRQAYRNGNVINLDVAPVIHNSRTLIPLRFFTEAYNCEVTWNGSTNTVRIISPPRNMNVVSFYALGDNETSSWADLFGKAYPLTSQGNTDVVDELALGWYSLDHDGNLLTQSRTGWQRPAGWDEVLTATRQYQLRTEMVIHATDGDNTLSNLLNNQKAMENSVASIVKEAELYEGVNLDFEGLGYRDEGKKLKAVQDSFTRYVQLLARPLQAQGKTLTVTLHPPNSAYRGYDYQALGKVADKIIIMAYEYGSKPEPTNMVVQAVKLAKAEVPANKLILGISAPGETDSSITTKIGIAKRYGLDGIALWRLGLVSDDMWNEIKSAVKTN